MRRVQELQATELDEGDIAAGKLDFQRPGVVRGPKQHRLLF